MDDGGVVERRWEAVEVMEADRDMGEKNEEANWRGREGH